jgi:hypothetical protein
VEVHPPADPLNLTGIICGVRGVSTIQSRTRSEGPRECRRIELYFAKVRRL